jgi:predicted ATP-grasp superfamily ATP-dependent carboligase
MAAIGYRGPLDVDYRLDPRDGRYKLLDVNPRIGASFRLFVGADGTDVLRAMYLDLTGQRLPTIEQRNGRRWLVEPQDLRSSLSHRRGGELTVGGWLRSLSGIEETAWWSRDDPWPFFAMLAQLLVGRLRRFGRGLWGASSARKAPR